MQATPNCTWFRLVGLDSSPGMGRKTEACLLPRIIYIYIYVYIYIYIVEFSFSFHRSVYFAHGEPPLFREGGAFLVLVRSSALLYYQEFTPAEFSSFLPRLYCLLPCRKFIAVVASALGPWKGQSLVCLPAICIAASFIVYWTGFGHLVSGPAHGIAHCSGSCGFGHSLWGWLWRSG